MYPHGIARIRFDAPNGPSAIRNGLDWLFASAHGRQVPMVEFHDGGDAGVGPHVRQPLDVEAARDLLRTLLALREAGLREPLPFAPYSGWELFNAPTLEQAACRRGREEMASAANAAGARATAMRCGWRCAGATRSAMKPRRSRSSTWR